jgi:hypothetical protein
MTKITWNDVKQEELDEKLPIFKKYEKIMQNKGFPFDETAKEFWLSGDIGGDGERYARAYLRNMGHEVGTKSKDINYDFEMFVKSDNGRGRKRLRCEVKTSRWQPTQGSEGNEGICTFSGIQPMKHDVCFFIFVEPTGLRMYYAYSELLRESWQNHSFENYNSKVYGDACAFMYNRRLNSNEMVEEHKTLHDELVALKKEQGECITYDQYKVYLKLEPYML